MNALTIAVMVAGGISSQPTKSTPAQRLALYIVSVSASADPYADELAERIIFESSHYGLDPAMFAAICYLESRFRMYPHKRDPATTLGSLWQVYPTREWLTRPRAIRLRLSKDIVVSTGRAALILARHARGRHSPAFYCRYNRTPCRKSYVVGLFRTARTIREQVWLPSSSGPRHAN